MSFEQTLSDLAQGIQEKLTPKLWRELEVVKLGNEIGTVLVPASLRQAKHEVYITFENGDVGKAINTQVGNRAGLEVWVGLPPTPGEKRLHVKEPFVRPAMDDLPPAFPIAAHAREHSLSEYPINGSDPIYATSDPVWIDSRQLTALQIVPSGGLAIIVTGGFIVFRDTILWFDSGSLDLTALVPGAGDAAFVLVEIDPDLVLSIVDGDDFPLETLSGLSAFLPDHTLNSHPVGFVRLENGQTDLDYSDIWAQAGLHTTVPSTGTREILVKAENLLKGATPPTTAIIGNFSVEQFAGVGGADIVYTSFHVPDNWVEGTDIDVHIHWAPIDGNAGDVKWQMTWDAVASEANEVISGAGTTTSVIDATQTLQDELLLTDSMTIAGASLAVGDTIGIKLFRDPADGADTYGSAASLVLVHFAYTAEL